MPLRSNTSSPLTPVSAGHGEAQAAASALAGTDGSGASVTSCTLPAMRKSPSRRWVYGKSHRSPCTRKATSRNSPACTARCTQARVAGSMANGR